MKKLILALFLFSWTINAQNFKKEILLDQNKDTITNDLFLSKVKEKDIWYKVEIKDSVQTVTLVDLNKYGNLSNTLKNNIISQIELLTNVRITSSEIIVINFFIDEKVINQKPCIDNYVSDNKYLSFFKKEKNKEVKQFFISDKSYFYENKIVIRDKNGTIENLVFSDALTCGNYVIIFPNNNYVMKHGEYKQEVILDIIKDYKKNNDK